MGGFGSGNHGGRPTVESGLTLDLGKLMRDGLLRPGETRTGSLVWSWVGTGERVASVTYQTSLGSEQGYLHLTYTTTGSTGEKRQHDEWIELVTTPQPFGGRRWWFVCPRTGGHVTKLHRPNGGTIFASRQAYRLAYGSQRQSPRDRALAQAFKQRRRLGNHDGIGGFIEKPKGMRWKTFDRAMERIDAIEDRVTAHTWMLLKQFA